MIITLPKLPATMEIQFADKKMNWQEAMDYCEKLGKGWRLPTIEELVSCVDYNKHNPATDIDGFKSVYYWSSTTSVLNTGFAWIVNFFNGNVVYNGKTYNFYVRPVAGGNR